MQVDWFKCKGGVWCELFKLDLMHDFFDDLEGVFILWTGSGEERSVLRVGNGFIRKELDNLKKDIAMQAFAHFGVYTTFTELPEHKQGGIVVSLAQELRPKMGGAYPRSIPVSVNLPW